MTIKEVNYGATKLQIKKFDIKNMCEYATICIIAKRATGKSFLVKELIYHLKDIPTILAISRTEKLNSFYSDFIPDTYIYSDYSSELLSGLFNRQNRIIEDNKQREKEGKIKKNGYVMLIMDDCLSSKGTWLRDSNILELFYNGRHSLISFILTLQYAIGIPPELRSNFDYIFLLAEDIISNRKRLFDHYAGMFPSFDVFQQVFSELTDNYGVMVIDNRIHSKNITDKVFWYKAKKVPPFKIGCNKYIKYHDNNYDDKWDKKIDIFNSQNLIKKKNNIKIIVEKIN
uniref:Uncharacterized protein n=1 Tax=viral metagenome TaxID=1070528 RepID=A0A6C0H6Y3_9ZZZZ